MNPWHLKVQATGPQPEVQLRHESGLCRGWSGDVACRLCRILGLHEGEQPCPKQQAWRLFLHAHAIEEGATLEQATWGATGETPCETVGETPCETLDEAPCETACEANCPINWQRKLAAHGLAPTPARTTIAA